MGVGIILLGGLLVFVPLFVQNTNNPTFKAKIPDEGSLVFSIDGVQYKGESYAISDIEAAVVYLESFQGFKYKERVSVGTDTSVSPGDNNKISYRYKGQIIDLTFILEQFSDYWSFKNLLMKWSASGVNVVLEKVFEDDFVNRDAIRQVIGEIVTGRLPPTEAQRHVGTMARQLPEADRETFVNVVEAELLGLHEGNYARYRISPSQFDAGTRSGRIKFKKEVGGFFAILPPCYISPSHHPFSDPQTAPRISRWK